MVIKTCIYMTKSRIQYIKEAAKKLYNSKLQRLGAEKTLEIFKGVMDTVGLECLEEVYLFVAQFDLTCRDRTSNLDDLSSYFECSSLDMVEYIPALKSLERKGFLVRRRNKEENIFKQDFSVNDSVMAAIIENQPIIVKNLKSYETQIDKYDFCKRIASKVENNDLGTDELVLYTENLEKNSHHLLFVRELKKDVGSILDRILFYDVCYDNVNGDGKGSSDIEMTTRDIYNNMGQRLLTRKAILEEEHILIKKELIELEGDNEHIRLTEKGKMLFYGADLHAFKSDKCRDIHVFIKKVYDLVHESNFNVESHYYHIRLHRAMVNLENYNKHLPEVNIVRNTITNDYERVLFYTIGHDLINNTSTSLSGEIEKIYPSSERIKVLKEFKDELNTLQKLKLVEIEKTSSLFGERTNLVLTDTGKEKLLGEDAALYINEVSNKQLILCDKIAEKKLFFSEEFDQKLSFLCNSLNEENYHELCNRLEEHHLPKGICVLLYGEPGTGKTESVMQIAKSTGRAIMHVDISATKTCWFGESEKLIKEVFINYRRLCDKSKIKPILLFNEADAVFSKRKDVTSGSVTQTENAIQNIILEEMEKLDGILVATTNLAENLDGAFERRFLFKLRFNKPTLDAKINIWMDKLPYLSTEDAKVLANFEFSGGQIDNIVRKVFMQEVINGERPTLNRLVTMCGEEKISNKNVRRIGFH